MAYVVDCLALDMTFYSYEITINKVIYRSGYCNKSFMKIFLNFITSFRWILLSITKEIFELKIMYGCFR